MKVIVYDGAEQRLFEEVSAVGIGHLRQDLVVVAADGIAIEIAPQNWTALRVDRVLTPAPEPSDEEPAAAEQSTRGYRLITLEDD